VVRAVSLLEAEVDAAAASVAPLVQALDDFSAALPPA